MIEQLNLFSPPRDPEPTPQPQANPFDDTWWRPKQDYRYNENGRESGWVRITAKYIAHVWIEDDGRMTANWYNVNDRTRSGWHWITEKDLLFFFEQIDRPEWWKK